MAQLTPIEIFLNIDPKKLGRRDDLGQKSFDQLVPRLEWMYSNLKEGIDLIKKNSDIENGFSNQINTYVNVFNGIAQRIQSYNLDSDSQRVNNIPIRDYITRSVNDFYTSFFNGDKIDSTNQSSEKNNFFVVLNALNSIDGHSKRLDAQFTEALKKSEEELKAITGIRKEAEAASRELTSKAFRPATLAIYAEYFNNEAKLHSRLGLPKIEKKNGIKKQPPMGGAERWLLAGLSTTIITLSLLIIDVFSFTKDDKFSAITVANGLIVAILFFLSRFFFKQYSIHKHLFTLNRQRANSLSSFFAMSESGGFDENSRTEISKILARAIYESAHTGYMPGDSNEFNLPVSIEMIKGLAGK